MTAGPMTADYVMLPKPTRNASLLLPQTHKKEPGSARGPCCLSPGMPTLSTPHGTPCHVMKAHPQHPHPTQCHVREHPLPAPPRNPVPHEGTPTPQHPHATQCHVRERPPTKLPMEPSAT